MVHFSKHYLSRPKHLLCTDNTSLRWLKSFKEPEGQLARCLETLESFNYDLQH